MVILKLGFTQLRNKEKSVIDHISTKAFYICLSIAILFILGACSVNKDIKDGRTAFDHKQYAVASVLLEEEYNKESDKTKKAELAYLLGESYKFNNENRPASKWYDKAVELGYGPNALYEMAYVLKKMERYALAGRYFKEILEYTDRKEEIRKEIFKCQEALKLKEILDANGYELISMSFNTEASEYSPQLLGENELVFTSDEKSGSDKDYKWTGRGFSDIKKHSLGSNSSSDFSEVINTDDNEGSATFNKTRDKIFFTRCYDEESDHYCKILMSRKDGNSWTAPVSVFPMDPSVNYRDPVLIENDSVLIFSCDDPKGFGGKDLYYSVLEGEDQWSAPDLMPPSINTIGDERFPTSDEDTLYFSSNFLAGLGGLDIFKTYLRADNSWSTPQNMGMPFNSSDDDFGLIFSPYRRDYVEEEGFFTSDRGAASKDDIYHFIKRSDKKIDTIATIEEEPIVEEEKEIVTVLNLKVVENSYAIANDPNSLFLGTKPVENASVILNVNGTEESLTTDSKGNILIDVEVSERYEFLVGKIDYLNTKDDFSFDEGDIDIDEGLKTFRKEILIDKIFTEVEIVIDNIYYDFNESFIREDAKPALDELHEMLVNNPALKIQLSSHTDCQGEVDYNQDLSQRRAQSAVNYIVEKGIKNEIIAQGYGESQLAILCECDDCSEDEHQLNRRTTFKILK